MKSMKDFLTEAMTKTKVVYENKLKNSKVTVHQYQDSSIVAFFTGFGETSVELKKFDKPTIDSALEHYEKTQGMLGSSLNKIK